MAQEFPHWGSLVKGKYEVGYRDTVIYRQDREYKYHNYIGRKPYFISIWYPAIDNPSEPFMKFADYLAYTSNNELGQLLDSIMSNYRSILIRDAICSDIKNRETVVYDDNRRAMFNDVLSSTVRSKRNLLPLKGKHPAIFYHHGYQSLPTDNNVFCEYMASYGYVVISSNYEWPVENSDLRMNDGSSDISFVVNHFLGSGEIDNDRVVAAGHSWGAQEMILHDTLSYKPFKGIISWHTTMEPYGLEKSKKMWPELMHAFQDKSALMTTPTMVFAPNSEGGPKYLSFKVNKHTPFTFVTVNSTDMTHDGFISLGNLREPYAAKYKIADEEILKQQKLYWIYLVQFTKMSIDKAFTQMKRPFGTLKADTVFLKLSTYNVK